MATATRLTTTGNYLNHTPVTAIAAGEVVQVGDVVGIATLAIAAGELGALATNGLFEVPKGTGAGTDIDDGEWVYWDATSETVSTDETDTYIGWATKDATTSDATVSIWLSQRTGGLYANVDASLIQYRIVPDDSVSIQTTLDAITDAAADKQYLVLVAPGTYTENVVIPSYVHLSSMGAARRAVLLTASSGTVLTPPATECNINGLEICGTGTATCVTKANANAVRLADCYISYVQQDGHVNQIVGTAGRIVLDGSTVVYTQTHSAGTGNSDHTMVHLSGTCSLRSFESRLRMTVADTGSGWVVVFRESDLTTDEILVQATTIHTVTTAFTGNVALFRLTGSGTVTDRDFATGHSHMEGGGSETLWGIYTDDTINTEIHTTSNRIRIAGGQLSIAARIGTNTTLISHFDDLVSGEPPQVFGTLRQANSIADGVITLDSLEASDEINLTKDLGALATGELDVGVDIVLDRSATTGGDVHAVEVSLTEQTGSAEVVGLATRTGVAPVHQSVGTPATLGKAWSVDSSVWTDRTSDFNGGGDVQIFTADNDVIYIGSSGTFDEIPVALVTGASVTIQPVFEYWDGAAWAAFTPVDNTNGFRQNGSIVFDADMLTGWATTQVNTEVDGPWYYVRITRTRNFILTPPTEDSISIIDTSAGMYHWTENGWIDIKTLRLLPRTAPTHHNDDGATALKDGTMYIDSGINKLMIRLNGAWETVPSS